MKLKNKFQYIMEKNHAIELYFLKVKKCKYEHVIKCDKTYNQNFN